MMSRSVTTILALAVVAANALPVAAQERGLSFSLTGGVKLAPDYFGASDTQIGPSGLFGFSGLAIGPARIGSLDGPVQFAPGAGLRGAFRYIPKREGRDELAGLEDVKAALELGFGVHYTEEFWQVFADLRYGAIGHRGFAGELGANAIYRGPNGLVIHGGPRAEFGDRRFSQTYFGVTPAESLASGLTAFSPGGGFHSLGVEIGAYQALSDDWGVTGRLRFDRLRGDAGASPIVGQGQRNQFTAEIGLTRHFNLRF
jgi:outer membrane scaffolding protein for murein synthesis (MipA/OmpV family)